MGTPLSLTWDSELLARDVSTSGEGPRSCRIVGYVQVVEFTADERMILLRALFELRITLADSNALPETARIEALVYRLGGDPDAPMFGIDPTGG